MRERPTRQTNGLADPAATENDTAHLDPQTVEASRYELHGANSRRTVLRVANEDHSTAPTRHCGPKGGKLCRARNSPDMSHGQQQTADDYRADRKRPDARTPHS